jgi:hypothetical protein
MELLLLVQCNKVSHNRHVATMHLHACRNQRNDKLQMRLLRISLDPLLDQNMGTQNPGLCKLIDYEIGGFQLV